MATANKNLSDFDYSQVPSAKDMKIGIVVAEWNEQITEGLYQGAMQGLRLVDVPILSEKRFPVVLS